MVGSHCSSALVAGSIRQRASLPGIIHPTGTAALELSGSLSCRGPIDLPPERLELALRPFHETSPTLARSVRKWPQTEEVPSFPPRPSSAG